jgi:hypothetical protein
MESNDRGYVRWSQGELGSGGKERAYLWRVKIGDT